MSDFELPPIIDSAALISLGLDTCAVLPSKIIFTSTITHKLDQISNNTDMEARVQQHHHDHSDGHDVVRSFIRKVARPIAMMRENYIDAKILNMYHISLQPLSFTTGQLHGGSQPFFQPIAPSQISKWLSVSGSTIFTEDFAFPDIETAPMQDSRIDEAAHFWAKILYYYLIRAGSSADVLRQTNWHIHVNDIHTLNRRAKSYGSWQVQKFFTYRVGPNMDERKDPTKPHITCFLADDAPLREGIVSTSELTTIVVLACTHASTPMYEHLPHIPITVVSGSGRCIRIVQGILDTRRGSLELYMSRIISFDKGIEANSQNFLTLLGWVVAKPVGTSPEHKVKQRSDVSPLRKVVTARSR